MSEAQEAMALALLRFMNSRISASSVTVREDAARVAKDLDESGVTLSALLELYIERVRKTS